MEEVDGEKLMRDLEAVVKEAEDLLKATAEESGDRIRQVRARAEEAIRHARGRMEATGPALEDEAVEIARYVEEQLRLHPWATAGVAVGIGVLLGILIARR
jgi:ElaB/YqjD/DUF883 family membrane-anchored ribosome-binding protein